MAASKGSRGGARPGAGRKGETKTAKELMAELGCPPGWLTPVEFCLAVMNNDAAYIKHSPEKRKEKKGGPPKHITISQRIEAARIAAPYLHRKLPEVLEVEPTDSWAQMVREGEERLRTMMPTSGKPTSGKSKP